MLLAAELLACLRALFDDKQKHYQSASLIFWLHAVFCPSSFVLSATFISLPHRLY